jgi:ABC-type xylose transport system permease subunit
MLMGVMSAVGALVFTARLNAATTAAGNGFELEVIASCIIGGTSTSGGIGTIFGAIIGALVMASLNNGTDELACHVSVYCKGYGSFNRGMDRHR